MQGHKTSLTKYLFILYKYKRQSPIDHAHHILNASSHLCLHWHLSKIAETQLVGNIFSEKRQKSSKSKYLVTMHKTAMSISWYL